MRQSRGYRDLVQEVTPRSRGQGTRRVRETRRTLKKAALRSSPLWAMRACPSQNYLRGIRKVPQKRPPRGQETGAFIRCVLPPLVEGWPWGVNIPHFGAARAWELSRLPWHQRKPWGRGQKDTQRTHEAWHYQHKVSMNLHGTVHCNCG